MYRITLFGIVLVCGFIFNGCSFLYKNNIFELRSNSGDWENDRRYYGNRDNYAIEVPEYYWLSHKSGNVTMYISPSGKEGRCLLFGPPLLPVVPNIFHFKQVHWTNRLKYFYVAVLIENNQPELKLDLSKIYFTINGKSVKPVSVNIDTASLDSTFSENKDFNGVWADSSSYRKEFGYSLWLSAVKKDTIEIKKKYTAIQFEFAEKNNDVDKLEMSFGYLFINCPEISIPAIIFQDKSSYLYLPFEFG